MKTLLFLLLTAVSFASSAVEPVNPEALCDRFLKPADQAACAKKTKKLDVDWYAASVCNLIDDDDQMMECLGKINGLTYAPKDLALCELSEMNDTDRVACLRKAPKRAPANQRAPAANAPVYQPLKISK